MSSTKGRILCVDDDNDTSEMITLLLGLEGYEVAVANSVREGLTRATTAEFDLILLDWTFRDGSGLDLCKRIREAGKSVPILFCSGMALNSTAKEAVRAGAQGFLVKPVDPNDLVQNLHRIIGD